MPVVSTKYPSAVRPNTELSLGAELRIVNTSDRYIDLTYNPRDREISYAFQNAMGERIESNLSLASNVRRIVVLNAGSDIAFEYFS